MASYTYKVRDRNGKVLQGAMDAVDSRELRKKLDERGYFIIEYSERKSRQNILSIEILPQMRRISLFEISIFSWQLYTMLDAGLTLVNSLKIIMNQTKNPKFKSVISDVCQRVEEGSSFADALKNHPKVFSQLFIQMVNAGEVGGVLDEMTRRLAVFYERQAEIRSKVKSAMIYPVVLLTISLCVIIFLVTVVLPQFAGIFREIGANIPIPTQFLLSLSVMIKNYWFIFVMLVIGCGMLFRIYAATDHGRLEIDRLLLNLPIIGDLIRKSIASRFTQTLSTLASGGIPIMTSLDVVIDTIGNTVVSKVLKEVMVSVGEGKPIAQPLERSKIFPEMVVNMIRVGEETGSLEKMLDKVADYYNREVNTAIEAFTKLIEPLLMVFMAVVIGFIALSIFLPMADLLKGLK